MLDADAPHRLAEAGARARAAEAHGDDALAGEEWRRYRLIKDAGRDPDELLSEGIGRSTCPPRTASSTFFSRLPPRRASTIFWRSETRRVDGVEAPICSLADLVAMKRSVGRERDLVDLADLESAHGELPDNRISDA